MTNKCSPVFWPLLQILIVNLGMHFQQTIINIIFFYETISHLLTSCTSTLYSHAVYQWYLIVAFFTYYLWYTVFRSVVNNIFSVILFFSRNGLIRVLDLFHTLKIKMIKIIKIQISLFRAWTADRVLRELPRLWEPPHPTPPSPTGLATSATLRSDPTTHPGEPSGRQSSDPLPTHD